MAKKSKKKPSKKEVEEVYEEVLKKLEEKESKKSESKKVSKKKKKPKKEEAETKTKKSSKKSIKLNFNFLKKISKKVWIISGISVVAVLIIIFRIIFLTTSSVEDPEKICEMKSIMPLGDSITLGSGADTLNGYREELHTKLEANNYSVDFVGDYNHGEGDWDKDHQGISGEVLEWYRTRLTGPDDFILKRNNPDIVLYHMGINNLAKGGDIDQYVSDLNDSLKVIFNYNENTTVILAQIIPTGNENFNERVTEFNDEIPQLKTDWENLIIVDMENILDYPEDYSDEIHPDAEGYSKIADIWYDAITQVMTAC